MNKNLVVFVVLSLLLNDLLAREQNIRRRVVRSFDVPGHRIWNTRPDQFVLPPSNCSAGNVSVQCTAAGGKLVDSNDGCTCECTEDKSTFGFHNGWKCIENNIFHALSGCSLKLDGRTSTSSSIITIPRTAYWAYLLGLPSQPSSRCNIMANKGSNLTCNGTWVQLRNSRLLTNKFHVSKQRSFWNNMIYWVFNNKDNLDALEGQVILLNIKCEMPQGEYCVIMKVNGNIKCPLPPTPTPTTATTSSTTQTHPRSPPSSTVTATITTTKPTTTHKRTSQEPVQTLTNPTTWTSILTELASSTPADHKVGHQSTTEAKQSTPFSAITSFFVEKNEKGASKERDNSGLIAGAVAGIIGLAVIVMPIMVIVRKRKKRECDEQRTDTFDNAGYGRGQDNSLRFNGQQSPDEDEYSYAYNNAVPFVKANTKALESYTSNDDELGPSVANRVYGQTEGLNQIGPASYNEFEVPVYNTLEEAVYAKVDKSKKGNQPNSDAPIYNTLEEPEYAKVDKTRKTKLSENHNEPLYNVLDGPQTHEGLSEEPPCYQVLEGPFSESAPVYDVLEGPESDKTPVYGALDGQDPHVYGALDRVTAIQGSPAENRGYDDMVYDSVGDVINEQGDIYQELNQSGQRDSDVYQALNDPNKTMQLNELNQTHSIA